MVLVHDENLCRGWHQHRSKHIRFGKRRGILLAREVDVPLRVPKKTQSSPPVNSRSLEYRFGQLVVPLPPIDPRTSGMSVLPPARAPSLPPRAAPLTPHAPHHNCDRPTAITANHGEPQQDSFDDPNRGSSVSGLGWAQASLRGLQCRRRRRASPPRPG